MLHLILKLIFSCFQITVQLIQKLFHIFSTNDSIRKTVKWIIIAALLAGFAIFIANTVTYLFRRPPTVPAPITSTTEKVEVVPQPPMRFTIQASAYLKKDHAEEFQKKLKKKEISAKISTAEGGGKIWYLIRIEQFATKAGAAKYGAALKEQGIIDDYFVDNLNTEEK